MVISKKLRFKTNLSFLKFVKYLHRNRIIVFMKYDTFDFRHRVYSDTWLWDILLYGNLVNR